VRDQRRLARQLGVSLGTVNRDFQALDAEYRRRAASDIATEKGLDLDRVEAMVRGLWPEAARGTWQAVDRVLACLGRKAKLLGLDAPAKVDAGLTLRDLAERVAQRDGLDPAAVLAEAEAVLRELAES